MFTNHYSKITDNMTKFHRFQKESGLMYVQKPHKEYLYIPKEDIFFAWLENIDLENDNFRVVTMSFPDLKKTIETYRKIKFELGDREDDFDVWHCRTILTEEEIIFRDIEKAIWQDNFEIVCSNWDFVKVTPSAKSKWRLLQKKWSDQKLSYFLKIHNFNPIIMKLMSW